MHLTLDCVSLLRNDFICVTSDEHHFLVADVMQAAQVKGCALLEPVALNTAAVLVLAALATKP